MTRKGIESLVESVAALIEEACAGGDNVAAISRRSGVSRPKVSRIRNKNLATTPTVETLGKIADSLGAKVEVTITRPRKSP